MSDDLVSRLLDDRHCNDWYLRQSAAQALTEARAEIERLRGEISTQEYARTDWKARALAAESELSTLRARVREVVRPFAKAGELFSPRLPDEYDQCIYSPAAGDEYSLCGDHLRAARQLMEDLK